MSDISLRPILVVLACLEFATADSAATIARLQNYHALSTSVDTESALHYSPSPCLTALKPQVKIRLGLLNGKALKQSISKFSEEVEKKLVIGKVTADVVVDSSSGRVAWAQIKSGPKLLRDEVAKMVCDVKFPPANDLGHNLMISGTLTWEFRRCTTSTKPFVYCLGRP